VAAVTVAVALVPMSFASAAARPGAGPLRIAVYGDSPYGRTAYAPGGQSGDTAQQLATPSFIATVDADASVSEVIHVGDIHSGKDFCTETWDNQIAALWQGFTKPLVYTPGDNEWSDCHKASSLTSPGEGGGFYSSGTLNYIGTAGLTTDQTQCVDYACGDPLANLKKVRDLFFAQPGQTLGSGTLSVTSQATAYDPAHPDDAAYVENVMWREHDVVFVTINVPGGSNNDADPWYKATAPSPAQNDERANRTAADVRWLDQAFAVAGAEHAKGVVITEQADMWDLDGKTPAHLTNYNPIINEIASLTSAFRRPVLLFNGDSHLYRSDNPMQQGAQCVGETDPATGASVCLHDPNGSAWYEHQDLQLDVPNLRRVTVHGSTFPLEYLRLTVDADAHNPTTSTSFGPFSWQRVQAS
jgi:hypothetical protein